MPATDNLRPNFAIEAAGVGVGDAVSALVDSLEYEIVDGMADVCKMRLFNYDFQLTDKRIFAPGNEMSVWMGYGDRLEHIGRVEIKKNHPSFPRTSKPMLEVVGYTLDSRMADNQPEASGRASSKTGRTWNNVRHSDVVEEKAADYGMNFDIDQTALVERRLIQKVGMSDYQLVQGLANLNGFVWWVDGDENGSWTLHFRNPELSLDQEAAYTLLYNAGNQTTLFSFEPEFVIQGSKTKVKVQTKNTLTNQPISEEVEVSDTQYETNFQGDPLAELDGSPASAEAVKLFIGEFSVEVVPGKRFKDAAQARAWAEQWLRRNRENFINARGQTIGVETLRARQTHTLDNLGPVYSGRYYFSRVRHVMSPGQGYLCDFNARKELG